MYLHIKQLANCPIACYELVAIAGIIIGKMFALFFYYKEELSKTAKNS